MTERLTLESIESWFKITEDEFSQIFSTRPDFNACRWVEENLYHDLYGTFFCCFLVEIYEWLTTYVSR